MATDLALYVLADPLHAALILSSTTGSGFDDGHAVSAVEFRQRGDGPWKKEALDKAAARDARLRPVLEDVRRRAAETLADAPQDAVATGTGIPIARLPGNRLKAMGLARRAMLEPAGTDMPEHCPAHEYVCRAFVIDATAHGVILAHGERAGVDVAALRDALDAGFGRVAAILAE
jgi:hypothetical protein